MSRNFGKKNGLKPHDAFVEASRYSLQSHNGLNQSTKHVKDFNVGELVFYGRIDTRQNFVVPNKSFLRTINSQNSQVQKIEAVDFVADAVNDINSQLRKMLLTNSYGKMNFTGFEGARTNKALGADTKEMFKNLTFNKGFVSPREEYETYQKDMVNTITAVLVKNRKALKIKDFNSFLQLLAPVIETISRDSPITFLKFLKSNLTTSMNSGLCVEFGIETFIDDQTKEDELISDPAYGTMVEVARQYGFFVDKNRPNRLVADLGSPIMMQYAANRGMTTQQEIFGKRFTPIREENYKLFLNLVYKTYTSLKISSRIERLSRSEFNSKVLGSHKNQMLSLYTQIRRQEEFLIERFDMNNLRSRIQNDSIEDFVIFLEEELKNLPREPYSLSGLLNRGRKNAVPDSGR